MVCVLCVQPEDCALILACEIVDAVIFVRTALIPVDFSPGFLSGHLLNQIYLLCFMSHFAAWGVTAVAG